MIQQLSLGISNKTTKASVGDYVACGMSNPTDPDGPFYLDVRTGSTTAPIVTGGNNYQYNVTAKSPFTLSKTYNDLGSFNSKLTNWYKAGAALDTYTSEENLQLGNMPNLPYTKFLYYGPYTNDQVRTLSLSSYILPNAHTS